jgi:serine/threonine-protein kinase
VDPEIPGWADAIVLKAMAKDPADRYQSAGDMRNDIQRALSGMPVADIDVQGQTAYQGTHRMRQATQMGGPISAVPPYSYAEDDGPRGRKRSAWRWLTSRISVLRSKPS